MILSLHPLLVGCSVEYVFKGRSCQVGGTRPAKCTVTSSCTFETSKLLAPIQVYKMTTGPLVHV
jgi:hypothetical protein